MRLFCGLGLLPQHDGRVTAIVSDEIDREDGKILTQRFQQGP